MLILFKNRFIKIIYSEFYNFNLDIAHQFFISISYLLFQKYLLEPAYYYEFYMVFKAQ